MSLGLKAHVLNPVHCTQSPRKSSSPEATAIFLTEAALPARPDGPLLPEACRGWPLPADHRALLSTFQALFKLLALPVSVLPILGTDRLSSESTFLVLLMPVHRSHVNLNTASSGSRP